MVDIDSSFALTAYQSDVWAANSHFPDLPQFNIFIFDRFTGELPDNLVVTLLRRAADHNDSLRLRIAECDGLPFQWVDERGPAISLVDLSGEADPARACADWLQASFDTPFGLSSAPLVELTALRESPDVVYLHVKSLHAVNDAWSLNLVMAQIRDDLSQYSTTGSFADAQHRAYRDFVRAEAEYRGSDEHRRDQDYFRELLAGFEPALYQRREQRGLRRSARYSFQLERSVIDRIRNDGFSVFSFFTSALAVYLSRAHRSDDVCIGVPLLNRPSADERLTVGHFANTLPIRVQLSTEQTFAELAAAVQAQTRQLKSHERLSFGDLRSSLPRDAIGLRREFDVTVAYLQWPAAQEIPGLEYRTVVQARAHDDDTLGIVVNELDEVSDVQVDLDYGVDVFDGDYSISDFARHLSTLIRNAVTMLDTAVTEIPMLDDKEHHRLVDEANATAAPYPETATLHSLFLDQVRRTPDAVALVDDATGAELTYRELAESSERWAAVLQADGVRPGEPVAVMALRSPEMMTAILGVLIAGGAYLPIDPSYPAERIQYVLSDSGARVLLTTADLGSALDTSGLIVRDLDQPSPAAAHRPASVAGPHDLAYVIYTSGSTGRPKGVLIEHRSAVNRLAWMNRRYRLSADDVLVQKTPTSFDVSVWELFWWTLAGARLVLLAPGREKDPRELCAAFRRHGVSVTHFVPSMLTPFLDELEAAQSQTGSRDQDVLRYVFCSGEALGPDQVRRHSKLTRSQKSRPLLVNLYGPTEATVDVSYFDCPADFDGVRVPIGRPIDNIDLHVLDHHGLVQPVGLPGELHIGGVGVARGYLDRPELTAEKFVGNDLTPSPRLYRTGDLAVRTSSGELEYLGRLDGQVKIRGNRVETGEVEAALADLPGIRGALVIARTRADGTGYLVGYVLGESRPDEELRQQLGRTLPDYMIPAYFQAIAEIPVTANGKVDRNRLPDVLVPDASTQDEPRTELEAIIAEAWKYVLGTAVGIHDNYFAVGGDSITMLQIRAQADKRGAHFALADLIRNPTVAELAAHASRSGPANDERSLEPFALAAPDDRTKLTDYVDAYPATTLQLALLFHSGEHEDSAVYHDVFAYSLRLRWDERSFRTAFDRLVERHPVLRSAFEIGQFSEPLTVIKSEVAGGLRISDLRDLPADQAAGTIEQHIEQRRYHWYAFDRAPLYEYRLFVLPDSVTLIFSFHHAILDGWSVATLVRELLQDYLHLAGAAVSPVVAEFGISAAYYVQAEQAALASRESAGFWRQRLAGAEPVQLEGLRAFSEPEPTGLIALRIELPPGLEEQARLVANALATPVKSVLLAAHFATLRLFTGTEDITTGVVTGGRPDRADSERMTGLFLATLPVRLSTEPADWETGIRALYAQEQDNHDHRHYPLSSIQRDNGGQPPFETAFNFVSLRVLGDLVKSDELDLLDFRTWEETNFALLLNAVVDPVDDRIWLRFDFDGRLFTRAQADQFAQTYLRLLAQLVADPMAPMDFRSLSTTSTAVVAPTIDRTVLDGIARHVRRIPDSIALVQDDVRWNYHRLWHTAGHIGRGLASRGAVPGSRIGIAMDRSPETIAAVLGVARAGYTCVPLDVTYPADRIAMMVDCSDLLAVITTPEHADLIGRPDLTVSVVDLLTEPEQDNPEQDDTAPSPRLSGDEVAYILFTSGSTGVPKGVAIPHRVLANYVTWQAAVPSGAAGLATLQFAPLSFDVSFQEILSTLYTGGTLVLIRDSDRRDMPALLRLLDRHEVARVFLPYVALQQLAEASGALGLRPRALRVIISSGEQLRMTDEIRRFVATVDGTVLENQYGPTETHLLTSHLMTGDPSGFPDLPPIGRPIAGIELRLLNAQLRPVPDGARGELYAAGVCLADGYFRQPELTAERFVTGPEGARLYRTGDLARRMPDGRFVWLGRADSQVKVRGFRVELAEVELSIRESSRTQRGMNDVAVVARGRAGGADAFLVAFLVGDPQQFDLDLLRSRLRASLPAYLVPSYFEWIDAFPRTASGKRDDAQLASMNFRVPESGVTAGREPTDHWERDLLNLARQVLEDSGLRLDDDFFDHGGTSLSAMRLTVLIEKHFDIELRVSALIAAPTMAALAGRVRAAAQDTEGYEPLTPIQPDGDRRPIFLVHPLGGNVLCYVGLAKYLGADQPVFAMQAPGMSADSEPLSSVPALASLYLEAIRRVQPTGPYLIGGWSFGGFIAFEMARQLSATGQGAVARLILIDPIAVEPGERPDVDDRSLLEWFFWELLWAEHGGTSPVEAVPAGLDDQAAFEFVSSTAAAAGVLPDGTSASAVRRLFSMFKAHWYALLTYQPEPTAQDLLLLKASSPLPKILQPMHGAAHSRHRDPSNGWSALTSGHIEIVEVSGDHLLLLEEPHVAEVAEVIRNAVEDDRIASFPPHQETVT